MVKSKDQRFQVYDSRWAVVAGMAATFGSIVLVVSAFHLCSRPGSVESFLIAGLMLFTFAMSGYIGHWLLRIGKKSLLELYPDNDTIRFVALIAEDRGMPIYGLTISSDSPAVNRFYIQYVDGFFSLSRACIDGLSPEELEFGLRLAMPVRPWLISNNLVIAAVIFANALVTAKLGSKDPGSISWSAIGIVLAVVGLIMLFLKDVRARAGQALSKTQDVEAARSYIRKADPSKAARLEKAIIELGLM